MSDAPNPDHDAAVPPAPPQPAAPAPQPPQPYAPTPQYNTAMPTQPYEVPTAAGAPTAYGAPPTYGAPTAYGAPPVAPYAAADAPEGQKSFIATWLLSWLVGFWGIDRFYLGKVGTGLAKLFTLGGLGVWWLIDLILVLTGAQRDKLGFRLQGYQAHKKVAWIITGAVMALGLLVNITTGGLAAANRSGAPEPAKFVSSAERDSKPTAPAKASSTPTAQPAPVMIAVPAGLVGMTAADAVNALAAAGLVGVYDGDPTAKVASVTPAVPELEKGSKLTLTLEQPPALSMGQQQAVAKAKSYLGFTAFSRSGLIGQLEYEGFSTDDATFAVDYIGVDWNAQAAAKAQSYLDFTSFSRDGLIEQLLYEGFSQAEAEFGVAAVGY